MKKYLVWFLFGVMVISFFSGCGSVNDNSKEDSGTVVIQINWPESEKAKVCSIPMGSVTIILTALASDMDPVTVEISYPETTGILNVKVGQNRTFQAQAKDASGAVLAKGETTGINIVGGDNPAVSISLTEIKDTTIPSAPGNFSASTKDSYIELSWQACQDNDLAGYKLYKMDMTDYNFNLLADLGKVTTYQDPQVVSGTTYIYSISSYDSAGNESIFSSWAYVTYIFTDKTPPSPPSGLKGTAGETSISLSWNANSESDLAGYNLYRMAEAETYYIKRNSSLLSSTSFSDQVSAGTNYTYRISAIDKTGNESEMSPVYEIKSLASTIDTTPPATPSGFSALAGDCRVDLSWNANGEADLKSYNVYRYRKDAQGKVTASYLIETTQTSYSDKDVVNGETYYYSISALDTSGNESAKSAEIITNPVSAIDDEAVIKDQLAIYEAGGQQMDVDKIMSVISANYSDPSAYGTTTRSEYQTSLQNSFDMNSYTSYSQNIISLSVDGLTASVKASCNVAGEGKKTANYDYQGYYTTAAADKTFTLAKENETWMITRDKTDKTWGFATLPWSYKAGYNIMATAYIMSYDNYWNFSNLIISALANDPDGNPIEFSPGMAGLAGYINASEGTYSTAVTLTDKNSQTYSLNHDYKVLASTKTASAKSVATKKDTEISLMKFFGQLIH